MNLRCLLAAALVAAAWLAPATAAAQGSSAISLAPANFRQWDASVNVGWFGSNESDIGAEWDDWYSAVSGGATAGRYFTTHFKVEAYAAVSNEGHIFGQEPLTPPGEVFPFRPREHFFRTAGVGSGVIYQLFENQWFHPFAGGGLELLREHHRSFVPEQRVPSRDPQLPFIIVPAGEIVSEVSYTTRPYLTGGFKWYVSQRGFFRADMRSVLSGRGLARVVWSAGIGADL